MEQAPDPTPRAPSSADLGGQTPDLGGHTARSHVQGAPRAQIWEGKKTFFFGTSPRSNAQGALERGFGGGKLKILGVAFPDPTSRAPSSADLGGGQKTIVGLAPPNPTCRAPSSADMGWRANYPSSTAHWKRKNILKPQSSAWIWGGNLPPQIQRPGRPGAQIWGGNVQRVFKANFQIQRPISPSAPPPPKRSRAPWSAESKLTTGV